MLNNFIHMNLLFFSLPYLTIFGGAVAFTKKQFEKVGGFSNMYFGWGGEDDDLYARVVYHNYSVMRYPEEIARYRMISHKKDLNNPVNPKRYVFPNPQT